MGLKGLGLQLRAGHCKSAHGGMGLGRGGMAAVGGNGKLQIDGALFRNAYKRAGLLDAGENILHNAAALVHHHGRDDALTLKILYDVRSAGAV